MITLPLSSPLSQQEEMRSEGDDRRSETKQLAGLPPCVFPAALVCGVGTPVAAAKLNAAPILQHSAS